MMKINNFNYIWNDSDIMICYFYKVYYFGNNSEVRTMRKILLLLVGLNLLLASAASSAEITKNGNGDVLSKFAYDHLDEKAKNEFIVEYAFNAYST